MSVPIVRILAQLRAIVDGWRSEGAKVGSRSDYGRPA